MFCSPVDVYFVSCSHDTTARLWSCDLAYPLRIFAGHTAGVNVSVCCVCVNVSVCVCVRVLCVCVCVCVCVCM